MKLFPVPAYGPMIRPDVQRAVRAAFELLTPEAPRNFRFFRNIVVASAAPVILAALSGCSVLAPTGLRTELSHDSHITVGSAHCTHQCAEDGLTRASVLLQWHHDGLLIEAGEGLNLRGRNGGGFYGPAEVFTGRVSYTFNFGSK